MSYVDGFLISVPNENREKYRALAARIWPLFKEFGAIRQVECWGDDVPDGKLTDFKRAVKLEEGEQVVFSWIVWPDKATADVAWQKMMEDPAMQEFDMPFDGKRMIWGGFQTIFES